MDLSTLIPVLVALIGSSVPFYVASRQHKQQDMQVDIQVKTGMISEVHTLLLKQLDDKEREINRLENRISVLDERIETQRVTISELRDEVDKLKREYAKLERQLDEQRD